MACQADVRDRDAVKTALREGIGELGDRLDIVVANAGIAPMAAADALAGRHRRQPHRRLQHCRRRDAADDQVRQRRRDRADQFGRRAWWAGVRRSPVSIGYAAAKHGIVGLMRVYANFLAPVQHSGQLRAPGRREHPDDRQRLHPVLAGRDGAGEPGRPRHGQRAAGAGAGARGHRQRGVLAGVRRGAATSPASRCPSTRDTSTSADGPEPGSADGLRADACWRRSSTTSRPSVAWSTTIWRRPSCPRSCGARSHATRCPRCAGAVIARLGAVRARTVGQHRLPQALHRRTTDDPLNDVRRRR